MTRVSKSAVGPGYRYRARVVSVYDGDTIRADISLGFDTWVMKAQLRLLGINAPEIRGPDPVAAMAARDRLQEILKDADDVVVETVKDATEKYGRYLARVFVLKNEYWTCANETLVAEGHATSYLPK